MSFGWSDLYRGNRFWAPVSEATLYEAGRAAALTGGMTLLETSCGNGAAAVYFAEEFHIYARGVDSAPEFVEAACAVADRSPAARRVRFFGDPPAGPVDALCTLRGPADTSMLRRGGAVVFGRFRSADDAVPGADPPVGDVVWSNDASPLEWERYVAPQERELRKYRRMLRRGDEIEPVALEAGRWIGRFRSGRLVYELSVIRAA